MHNRKDTGRCHLLNHDLVKVTEKKLKKKKKSDCPAFTDLCLLCEGGYKTYVREATILLTRDSGRKVVSLRTKPSTSTVDAPS